MIIFKERLHKTLQVIWNELILPIIFLLLILSVGIVIILYVPIIYKIIGCIIGISIGVIALIGLFVFMYWLFIEPFIKSNVKEEEK